VAVGTVKARVHGARRLLNERVMAMSRNWHGECEWPEAERPTMPLEGLAKATLAYYGLGSFEGLGSVYEPHGSLGVGVRAGSGRYRLWRCRRFMTAELVALQHAMLERLGARGVPAKRLVRARDAATWQEVDGQLVSLYEWFSGPAPDLTSRREVAEVATLHARWTLAMAEFDPPIPGWREVAARWRPRKPWAWVLPTEELPLVPQRMRFFAAVRDVEDPPSHHERMLGQVRDTEARLARFATAASEFGLARLPRAMNHGVFLLGCVDWEPMVTDADDFQYEARIGDLGRLLFAIHDWRLPHHRMRDQVALAVDTYCAQVDLSPEELRALPLYSWAQLL